MKILITGASNGMGKGLANVLAGADDQQHEIIMLCRNEDRGNASIKEINNSTSNNKTSLVLCDLLRMDDTKKAIKEIKNQHDSLDAIFFNAGLGYAPERVVTIDGMDAHFQVNYLSQFMLIINLLELLEKSKKGGKVIFNVTEYGDILWDDMQLKKKWSYEKGIFQAMAAKRMFLIQLHKIYDKKQGSKLSFIGFRIHKTVWTNQINIIPFYMKMMARLMKFFGTFISIEECGQIMAPLFLENLEDSRKRSGKIFTWKKNEFFKMKIDDASLSETHLEKLWKISVNLCNDHTTFKIAQSLVKPI